jgi:hypothetical protein
MVQHDKKISATLSDLHSVVQRIKKRSGNKTEKICKLHCHSDDLKLSILVWWGDFDSSLIFYI